MEGATPPADRPSHVPADEEIEVTGYKRVLLKLSGEAFGGGKVGVDPDVVSKIASEIADVVRSGTEVAIGLQSDSQLLVMIPARRFPDSDVI